MAIKSAVTCGHRGASGRLGIRSAATRSTTLPTPARVCAICATKASCRLSPFDGGGRAVTLTDHGQHLLDKHRHERDGGQDQTFYADVRRARELPLELQLYQVYLDGSATYGGDVRRVVLDHEVKRA